ncbi:MAG: intracellular septation protein [Halieaceae bacterium]|jgi:intracellular septation protein
MKQLAELIPLALFVIAYQFDGTTVAFNGWSYYFDGIFSATAALIIATCAQVILTRLISGRVEKRLLWLLAAVVLFGGATLIFRDKTFIIWKPTVFNWGLALVFAGSAFIGEKTLLARTLGSQVALPEHVWRVLNWTWVVYFVLVGGLNIVVAYRFDESFWVSYKLYSAIGFTILISMATVFIISPHLKEEIAEDDTKDLEETPEPTSSQSPL